MDNKTVLMEALERMDRARAILTNGNPTPNCNWGMLDTSDLRQRVPPAASEAGAVPLAYLWTHGTQKCLFYTHRRAQMHADSHGGGVTPLYAAPAAQPEKQAGQDDAVELLKKFMDYRDADYVPNGLFERASKIIDAAPPAPSQQAAPGAEPDYEWVQRGLELAKTLGAHPVGSALHSKSWLAMRDYLQERASPAAESAEPTEPPLRDEDGQGWHWIRWYRNMYKVPLKAARAEWDIQIAATTAATADAQGNIAASVSDKAGCISHSAGSDKQADAQGDERAADIQAIDEAIDHYGAACVYQGMYGCGGEQIGDELRAMNEARRRKSAAITLVCKALSRQPSAAASAELTPAARDVLAERQRQISVEGWHAAEDDNHEDGQMAAAAACYAMFTQAYPPGDPVQYWPWDKSWWKPSTPRRNLVKAGALILAEIERLDRAALAAAKPEGGAE
ncbi:hypothetical protein [Bordetella genomosp. 11]|uniref:Uncharacterized protein n=1 Tax=Bordetella genomosp. 11 TaxID=1416808 RepID=A0A261UE90_9BORD|nr:hypothetical protein [Bordetella genomosp. 11]OZI59905.1 hypothetical protein CAL28_10470 [Bordetella genomosp. 11]